MILFTCEMIAFGIIFLLTRKTNTHPQRIQPIQEEPTKTILKPSRLFLSRIPKIEQSWERINQTETIHYYYNNESKELLWYTPMELTEQEEYTQ